MSDYKSPVGQGPQPSNPSGESTWSPQDKTPLGDYFTKKYQPEYNIPCVKDRRNCLQDLED